LDREKPLNFYGIQNGSELRVIEDPLSSVAPDSLLASIKWATLPGTGDPYVFVMPDLRQIVRLFQPETTLQVAANDLNPSVGCHSLGFRIGSEVLEPSRTFGSLPTIPIHLFIILDPVVSDKKKGTV
jgi:hypothetical protein